MFSASTCYVTATTVTACTRRKKKSIIADLYDEDADISFDTVTRYWIGYIIQLGQFSVNPPTSSTSLGGFTLG